MTLSGEFSDEDSCRRLRAIALSVSLAAHHSTGAQALLLFLKAAHPSWLAVIPRLCLLQRVEEQGKRTVSTFCRANIALARSLVLALCAERT